MRLSFIREPMSFKLSRIRTSILVSSLSRSLDLHSDYYIYTNRVKVKGLGEGKVTVKKSACSFLLFVRDWIVTAKILEFFGDLWYFYKL